jgi:LmbE family N-acetylglucosaminyl deacetylase
LGLEGVYFMGYRDSGMPGMEANRHPQALVAQPLDKVAEDIVKMIRELRPEVVITFDPIGGYRHPDHIAIHQATVRAFYAAGDPQQFPDAGPAYAPPKLYFHVIPHGLMRMAVRLMPIVRQDPRHFGRNKDIDLASLVEVSFPVHAVIDYRSVARIRDEAAACHASQGGGQLIGGLVGWLRKRFATREMFMQAYPPPNGKVVTDLFAGG